MCVIHEPSLGSRRLLVPSLSYIAPPSPEGSLACSPAFQVSCFHWRHWLWRRESSHPFQVLEPSLWGVILLGQFLSLPLRENTAKERELTWRGWIFWMVIHASSPNPRMWKQEDQEGQGLCPNNQTKPKQRQGTSTAEASLVWQAPDQPELHNETLSKPTTIIKKMCASTFGSMHVKSNLSAINEEEEPSLFMAQKLRLKSLSNVKWYKRWSCNLVSWVWKFVIFYSLPLKSECQTQGLCLS